MTSTKITIQVQGMDSLQHDHTVVIGEKTVRQHKIPTSGTVTLKFGVFRQQVKVVSASHVDGLRIHPSLAGKMGLHYGARLGLYYKGSSRTLTVGPLIGVMMNRTYSAPDRPFGSTTAFCRELADAAQVFGAFAYFFTVSDIPQSGLSVNGWTYSGRWQKRQFPIPDVVYNRLTTRKLENQPSVQRFMKEAKSRHGAAVFNEKYLNKNEVFDALKHEASLLKHLPESHLLKSSQTLKKMIDKYNVVFLKPITGSLGKGIIRISKLNNQSYTCMQTTLSGTTRQTFSSLSALTNALAGKLKRGRYQIQQGLSLIEAGGRPVDFRALVQRNGEGVWNVTSVVARTAGSNHFVSNVARGGTLSRAKEALQKTNFSASQQAAVLQQLRKTALNIAAGIEKQMKEHFGELGVDLAVDTKGKVWLIEVNSKPSKNDGTPLAEGEIRPSVKLTVQYARFLSGF